MRTFPIYIAFRFKRDVEFPRFSMLEGQEWQAVIQSKNSGTLRYLEAAEGTVDRFKFAGGFCLVCDIEFTYIGNNSAALYIPSLRPESNKIWEFPAETPFKQKKD